MSWVQAELFPPLFGGDRVGLARGTACCVGTVVEVRVAEGQHFYDVEWEPDHGLDGWRGKLWPADLLRLVSR